MIDLTLDRLKRPAIKGSIYNFGTTVEVTNKNKGGLSTTEVDANVALAYELQREVNISASDTTSIVEYNAKLAFVGDEFITLKLLNGSFTGCTVKIANRGSQTNRIEFNDNDALSVGPTQSYTLEWTGGNWWLGKEDADILKVTFTVEGGSTQFQEGKDIPCVSDVPIETIKEYAKTGAPIEAIIKVPSGGSSVITYTCNNIATATTSSSAGEMTQLVLSGWMYTGEKQIFLNLAVNSNDNIKLYTKTVDNTVLDNTSKYTFIVDSNEAVFQWAHNIKDSGQDYTRVLVKKGEWGSNFEDLGIIGTKIIEGEPGAVLDSGMIPLGYSVKPNESDYYIRGLKVFGGLRNCVNITNCISSVFIGCSNLINCSSPGTMNNNDFSAKFEDCSNLTNCQAESNRPYSFGNIPMTAIAFKNCRVMTSCKGSGVGGTIFESGSPRKAEGYAFYDCVGMSRCEALGYSTTSVFKNCYASLNKTSTYQCADTANGGFNMTTNPSE